MWPDKETEIDYLNFGYMVDLVVDIATNRELSPSTIGLYGDWGSGKSSLMKLAQKKIEEKNPKNKKKKDTVKSLCIEFNGWLFEGYEDTKTSCERFNTTVQNEFYAISFRKKISTNIEQLQTDLDAWMNSYNTERTHFGKYCFGKTYDFCK